MVQLAREWVTVPPQKICETRSNPINRYLFFYYLISYLEIYFRE